MTGVVSVYVAFSPDPTSASCSGFLTRPAPIVASRWPPRSWSAASLMAPRPERSSSRRWREGRVIGRVPHRPSWQPTCIPNADSNGIPLGAGKGIGMKAKLQGIALGLFFLFGGLVGVIHPWLTGRYYLKVV